jgi:hypothetical protein
LISSIIAAFGILHGCAPCVELENPSGGLHANLVEIRDADGELVVSVHDLGATARIVGCDSLTTVATVGELRLGWDLSYGATSDCLQSLQLQWDESLDGVSLTDSSLRTYGVPRCSVGLEDCSHCPADASRALRFIYETRPETPPAGWCDGGSDACFDSAVLTLDLEFWESGAWEPVKDP